MNEAENKKEYEMSYLLTADIPEDKIDSEVAELKNIITENGGIITHTTSLEKKRLAYLVKKQNYAYFGVVWFEIDGEGLDKIKKVLALNKKILRYLILNEIVKPKPSVVITPKISEIPAPAQSFDQRLESILKS